MASTRQESPRIVLAPSTDHGDAGDVGRWVRGGSDAELSFFLLPFDAGNTFPCLPLRRGGAGVALTLEYLVSPTLRWSWPWHGCPFGLSDCGGVPVLYSV